MNDTVEHDPGKSVDLNRCMKAQAFVPSDFVRNLKERKVSLSRKRQIYATRNKMFEAVQKSVAWIFPKIREILEQKTTLILPAKKESFLS